MLKNKKRKVNKLLVYGAMLIGFPLVLGFSGISQKGNSVNALAVNENSAYKTILNVREDNNNFSVFEVENETPTPTEGLNYSFNGSDGYILSGMGSATLNNGELVIPSVFNDGENGEHPVVEVSSSAFRELQTIVSVYIPNTIVTIGNNAFRQNLIEEVVFEDNSQLTTIGEYAFAYNELTDFIIPESVQLIKKSALRYNQIEIINIPSSVVTIEQEVLRNNSLNEKIVFINRYLPDDENPITVVGGSGSMVDKPYMIIVPNMAINAYKNSWPTTYINNIYDNDYYNELINNDGQFEYSRIYEEDGVTYNGYSITAYNGSETNITIPSFFNGKPILEISNRVFRSRNILSVEFEEGSQLTTIGEYAFAYNQLSSVLIPSSVVEVGGHGFRNNQLTEVIFEEGSQLTTVGQSSFRFNSIETVNIPSSVVEMGQGTFRNNNSVNLMIYVNRYVPGNDTEITLIFDAIVDYPYVILVPDDAVDLYRDNWYRHSNNIYGIVAYSELMNEDGFWFDRVYDVDGITVNGYFITDYTGGLTEIEIPSVHNDKPVLEIGYEAFYNKQLTSVVIPNSVTTIADRAFANNNIVEFIVNADNEHYSSDNGVLFNKNQKTLISYPTHKLDTEYIVPNTVNTIAWNAFYQTQYLNEVTIPTSVLNIEDYAFKTYSITLIKTDFADQPQGWGWWWNPYEIEVEWGSFIPYFDADNFSFEIINLSNLEVKITGYHGGDYNLTIPNEVEFDGYIFTVTEIGDWAFAHRQLTSVVIPNSVTTIGDNAFADNQLTSVVIPNNVTIIGGFAFADNQLTSLIFEEDSQLITIGDFTFTGNKLEGIVVPNSVTTISYGAFADSQLKKIVFENESKLTTIGNFAFANNLLITAIIPSSVENMGEHAFDGNHKLVQIRNLTGINFENWLPENVLGREILTDETTSFTNTLSEFDESGFQTFNVINEGENNGIYIINYNGTSTNLDLTSYYYDIYNYAFANSQLTSVVLPSSVTSIGDGVFLNNQLTNIEIPSSVTSIGQVAFAGNQLTNIEIPSSVTSIGNWVFANNQLINVNIPSSVTSIGDSAFAGNQLTSVEIPNSVMIIGNDAFNANFNLSELTFADNSQLQKIGGYAFRDTNLKVVELPESVILLGDYVFPESLSMLYVNRYLPGTEYDIVKLEYEWLHPVHEGTLIVVPDNALQTYKSEWLAVQHQIISYSEMAELISEDGYVFERIYDEFEENIIGYRIINYIGDSTELVIPSTNNNKPVLEIGQSVFASKGLTKVEFAENSNIRIIYEKAFGDNQLTSVVIPSSVTNIYYGAFGGQRDEQGRPALYNVTINRTSANGITEIDSNAFGWDVEILTIIVPSNSLNDYKNSDSPWGWEYYDNIISLTEGLLYNEYDDYAVVVGYNGSSTEVFIPLQHNGKYVTEIANDVFKDMGLTKIVLPSGLIRLGAGSLALNNLTQLHLPATIREFTAEAIYGNPLENVDVSFENEHFYSEGGVVYLKDSNENLTKIVYVAPHTNYNFDWMPQTLTQIGDYAFYGNNTNNTISISSNITYIGNNSFQKTDSSGYLNISINRSNAGDITLIGNNVFSVTEHTKIYVEDEVFNEYASHPAWQPYLAYLTRFSEYVLSEEDFDLFEILDEINGTVIGVGINNYKGLSKVVTIPNTLNGHPVLEIGWFAFNNKSLRSVVIPNSVTEIGNSAFANNQLTHLSFENGSQLTTIGQSAFTNNQLESVTLPDSVETINQFAFQLNNFKSFYIPASLQEFGRNILTSNPITHIEVSPLNTNFVSDSYANNMYNENMKGILYNADKSIIVWYADGLSREVTADMFASTVVEVANYAFSRYNGLYELLTVEIPNGVKKIGYRSYAYNSLITILSIPASVELSDVGAVNSTNSRLETILVHRSLVEHGSILELEGAPVSTIHPSVRIYVPGDSLNAYKEANYWSAFANQIYSMNDYVEQPYYTPGIMFELQINELTQQEEYAVIGYDGDDVDIIIPEIYRGLPVTKIGDGAFLFANISSVLLPDSITYIGYQSFAVNNLTSIIIPDGVIEIDYGAFLLNKLTHVTIPKSVQIIGVLAFGGNLIEHFEIDPLNANFVAHSYENSMRDDNKKGILYNINETIILHYGGGLEKIITADMFLLSVTEIQTAAFAMNNLISVEIPSSVIYINDTAFFYQGDFDISAGILSNETLINVYVTRFDAEDSNPITQIASGFVFDKHSNLKIYVPHGSLEHYINDEVWSEYSEYLIENITPVEVDWSNLEVTYNGLSQKPIATILIGEDTINLELQFMQDGEVVENPVNAGVYDVTAVYNESGYVLTNPTNILTINKAVITVVGNGLITKQYDGNSSAIVKPENYLLEGLFNEDNVNLNFENALFNSKDVLTANKVIVSGVSLTGSDSSNYYLNGVTGFEINASITKKALTISVNEDIQKTFGNADPALNYVVNGLISGETLAGELTRELGENVGVYNILPGTLTEENNPNYEITYSLSKLIINALEVSEIEWLNTEVYYNGKHQSPIVNVEINNNIVEVNLSFTLNGIVVDAMVNAGIYEVTASSNNLNYVLKANSQSFIINKAIITVVGNGVITKEYNGNSSATVKPENYTLNGLVNNDNVSLQYTLAMFNSRDVLTANKVIVSGVSLAGSDSSNYDLNGVTNFEVNASITRKTVTITITDNLSKVKGQLDPKLTYTAVGLVANEILVGELTRETGENKGKYKISTETLTNENNPNYNIVFANEANFEIKESSPVFLYIFGGVAAFFVSVLVISRKLIKPRRKKFKAKTKK